MFHGLAKPVPLKPGRCRIPIAPVNPVAGQIQPGMLCPELTVLNRAGADFFAGSHFRPASGMLGLIPATSLDEDSSINKADVLYADSASSLVASHLTSGITQRPKKIPIQPEGQTGKARVSHRRRETTSVASGGFLGRLALVRREFFCHKLGPDQPPVIGAQVSAGYFAIGGPFNGWAALNRYRTKSGQPLIDCCGRNTEKVSQGFLASNDLAGFLYSVHEANYSNATDYLQAMLQKLFGSVAI